MIREEKIKVVWSNDMLRTKSFMAKQFQESKNSHLKQYELWRLQKNLPALNEALPTRIISSFQWPKRSQFHEKLIDSFSLLRIQFLQVPKKTISASLGGSTVIKKHSIQATSFTFVSSCSASNSSTARISLPSTYSDPKTWWITNKRNNLPRIIYRQRWSLLLKVFRAGLLEGSQSPVLVSAYKSKCKITANTVNMCSTNALTSRSAIP